jgi:peptidyl-prolyl cis-trans isomerase C
MMSSTETVFAGPQPSPARRWLREPLLHFLLIGLALFAIYRALNPAAVEQANRSRIELTGDDLRQLEVGWIAQWRRPPTPDEMRRLVDSKVREEILYREALALGLDQGDTIVKRRMAQKMEFLAEDVSDLREPSRDELAAWFATNARRFTVAGRMSFRHLYFSFDKRGERAYQAAEGTLAKLVDQPADWHGAATLADPVMFQDFYSDRSPEQVANVFGAKFARSLFHLEPGSWQGPIESGFGWHLVWVDSKTPTRVPAFEEVESAVRSEWVADQRAEFKRQAFDAMKARYEIVLPDAPANAAAGNGTVSGKEAP